jgi:hypothetical protein
MSKSNLLSAVLVLTLLSGCAGMQEPGNEIHLREDTTAAPDARQQKYPVAVRLAGYVDARDVSSPRRIGTLNARVLGMSGPEIMLDRDVAAVVGAAMKKRLSDDGLQFVDDDKAQFQLGGTVKALTLDVKERDYLNLVIETSLTEVATGRVIWSGVVTEKKERYAGVSGNGKGDIAAFLKAGLNTVSRKTSESILPVMMGTHPELFGSTLTAKTVPGVTALPAATTQPAAATGKLVLTSVPERVKVYVDDVYYGLTPVDAEMPAGIYTVRLELDGYRTASEKLSVRAGQRTELEMKLQR